MGVGWVCRNFYPHTPGPLYIPGLTTLTEPASRTPDREEPDYGCPRINEVGHGPISLAARMADELADGSKVEYYSEGLLRRIENP